VTDAPDLLEGRLQRRGVRDGERDELRDARGIEPGGAVGCGRAPVVSDDDRALRTERRDEREDVARERLQIGVALGDLRRVIATREGADRAIALRGDARADVVPGVGRIRKAVDEEDEWAFALLEKGETKTIGLHVAERCPHRCEASGQARCGLFE
jgi:hypothetical protein